LLGRGSFLYRLKLFFLSAVLDFLNGETPRAIKQHLAPRTFRASAQSAMDGYTQGGISSK
jgi:hypothetical protein